MFQPLLLKSVITWFLFIPFAIINGIIREKWYKHFLGELFAHQLSTITASLAFITLSYVMLKPAIFTSNNSQLIQIGTLWVLMTVIFEFGFGHYIDKVPWKKLFADYNIFTGHIWGLFLLIIFFTPFIIRSLFS